MSRKTVSVEHMVFWANENLASEYHSRTHRQGIRHMTEEILMMSGNYKGFRYLNKDETHYGQLPGINTDQNTPAEALTVEQRFENTDNSRVHYYV